LAKSNKCSQWGKKYQLKGKKYDLGYRIPTTWKNFLCGSQVYEYDCECGNLNEGEKYAKGVKIRAIEENTYCM